MINNTGKLSFIESYKGNDMIFVSDGNTLEISHIGDAHISTKDGKIKLNDVLVISS